jgi:hypothetical protein
MRMMEEEGRGIIEGRVKNRNRNRRDANSLDTMMETRDRDDTMEDMDYNGNGRSRRGFTGYGLLAAVVLAGSVYMGGKTG